MGYGHAPECSGGRGRSRRAGTEGKIFYENDRDREEAREHQIFDFDKIYRVQDLIRSKEVAIAATGVTDGEFLEGVRFTTNGAVTNSFIARGETRTYRNGNPPDFFDYKPVF